MSIRQLPGDVVAQIKSSIVITSLNAVACGLVRNSLDAQASKINISVDYRRGNCSVEDDGQGVPPPEFHQDGGLGKLHYTSRFPHRPDCHGRHGVFLASVAALSLLSVTSHHHLHGAHNSLTIHNSKVLARHTPALPEQRILTFPHGTRVTVRDLFGAMPVRVKQRAIDAERQPSGKDWDHLVRSVVALLLAWPGQATVGIRDSGTGQTITLKGTEPLGKPETGQRERERTHVVRITRLLAQSSLSDISDVDSWVPISASAPRFLVSGCVSLTPAASKRVQFISLGIGPLLNENHSNVLYEEVNRVFSNSSFGTLEDDDGSDVGDEERKLVTFTGRELKTRKGIDRWPKFYLKIDLDPAASASPLEADDVLDDRRPDLAVIIDLLRAMFYEFLKRHHLRPQTVQLSMDTRSVRNNYAGMSVAQKHPSGNTPSISDALGSTTLFKRRKLRSTDSVGRSSVAKSSRDAQYPRSMNQQLGRRETRSASPFTFWTRVKSGRRSIPTSKSAELAASSRSPAPADIPIDRPSTAPPIPDRNDPSRSEQRLVGPSGKLLRRPFEDFVLCDGGQKSPAEPFATADGQPRGVDQRETFVWKDPISKMSSTVDARTGFVIKLYQPSNPNTRDLPTTVSTKDQTTGKEVSKNTPSPWLNDLLSSWKSPVFELTEPSIPCLSDITDPPGIEPRAASRASASHSPLHALGGDGLTSLSLQGRISKPALQGAQVISQVDHKFILARVGMLPTADRNPRGKSSHGGSSCLLVLIDQHAADERCRVEALMRDYFYQHESEDGSRSWKACTVPLDKPVQYDLSAPDRRLLERFGLHFKHWGIVYDSVAPGPGTIARREVNGGKVRVSSLPPSILERCRLEPRLLIDILRKEAWKLEESGQGISEHTVIDSDQELQHSWVARFHACPQGIMDMINSRACRSAIMFNDPLSQEECTKLLRRLASCAFPFQCAHGRPSMVPLLDLGSSSSHSIFRKGETPEESFLAEFKRWKAGGEPQQ